MTDEELAADIGPVYDRQGHRITIAEYRALRADPAYAVVAFDRDGERRVSTRWFGSDLSAYGAGCPIETIVFDGRREIGCERYGDERAALEGHARLCREHLGREPRRLRLISSTPRT